MRQLDMFEPGDVPINELDRKFREFHSQNPQVYELVKRFAFEAIRSGRTYFGIGMIFERIRWYTTVETVGNEFKLCNDHRAYYARMFMRDFPEYDGFFRTKKVKGEEDEESY